MANLRVRFDEIVLWRWQLAPSETCQEKSNWQFFENIQQSLIERISNLSDLLTIVKEYVYKQNRNNKENIGN